MADFTSNMTSVAALDNSVYTAMDQAFIIASQQTGIMDQFVTLKKEIGATAIEFPKYGNLALATTALTDKEDVSSVAMSDSQIILTPREYGNVVTKTMKVSLASGGKADLAVAQVVAANMLATQNKLAMIAAASGSNKLFGGTAANEAALTGTDVMAAALFNKMYNKLSKAGVAKFGEHYVAVLHPDQIFDLKAETGSGSWLDVNKYGSNVQLLKGEIGTLGGFRVIEDAQAILNPNVNGTVDSYSAIFMGFNALGKAVSKEAGLVVSPAGDKLQRFLNVGWYGVFGYGLVDTDACWMAQTSSSIGV